MQSPGLRPGDRLVMLTDGMLERNAKSLNPSGLIIRSRALPPRGAARTLIGAIVDAVRGGGNSRRDAATDADLTDASQPSKTERAAPGQ
ncbi:hypothetical protein ACIRO3_23635 [Streptomyces sp. NPDC102278]|uniref:hypothetical protein n=1 Tax=Streptomyces sp. NPDC102278 TaxID=3366152 RepID=UPI00380A4516